MEKTAAQAVPPGTVLAGNQATDVPLRRNAGRAAMGVGMLESKKTKREVTVVTPESLREALGEYERTYQLSSEEFLRRWEGGELEERREYFRWYGTCHLAMSMGVLPLPKAGWHALR